MAGKEAVFHEAIVCLVRKQVLSGKITLIRQEVQPFQVHTRLWYFTLAKARRFYSSRGGLLDTKRLLANTLLFHGLIS